MTNQIITKQWLKQEEACKESYLWLEKQKNRNWKHLSQKLYKEQKYDWCFWLLYRKTTSAKIYTWFLMVLSLLLSVISYKLAYEGNYILAVIFVTAAVIFVTATVVFVTAAVAFVATNAATVVFVVAAAVTTVIFVTAAVAAAVILVTAAVTAAVVVATVAYKVFIKIGCKISLKR